MPASVLARDVTGRTHIPVLAYVGASSGGRNPKASEAWRALGAWRGAVPCVTDGSLLQAEATGQRRGSASRGQVGGGSGLLWGAYSSLSVWAPRCLGIRAHDPARLTSLPSSCEHHLRLVAGWSHGGAKALQVQERGWPTQTLPVGSTVPQIRRKGRSRGSPAIGARAPPGLAPGPRPSPARRALRTRPRGPARPVASDRQGRAGGGRRGRACSLGP